MKKKLIYKFLFPVLMVFLAIGVALFFLISYEIGRIENERVKVLNADFIRKQARHDLTKDDFIDSNYSSHQVALAEYVSEIKNSEIVRVKIWNTSKQIIYSDVESDIGEIFSDNDELAMALQGEIIAEAEEADELGIKYDNTENFEYENMMELYVPIAMDESGEIVGVAETYVNLDNLDRKIFEFQMFFLASLGAAFALIFMLILFFLKKYILAPLKYFVQISNTIIAGDLKKRVEINSQDEVGHLAEVFNQMLDSIEKSNSELKIVETELREEQANLEKKVKERTRQLEEIKAGLDDTIKQQTAELREKLEENKKVNDMVIGRETKMIELKEEIERLKEQLNSKK